MVDWKSHWKSHMYGNTELVAKMNDAVLNDLLDDFYTIETDNNIPDNCKQPLRINQADKNQKNFFDVSSDLDKKNCQIHIKKWKAENSKNKKLASPSIKDSQLPLILVSASSVFKVVGLRLEQGAIDFHLRSINHLYQGKYKLTHQGKNL